MKSICRTAFLMKSIILALALLGVVRADAQDISVLIEQLSDEASVDEASNQLFTIGGPALPYLLEALSHDDVQVRQTAITLVMGMLAFNSQAMKELNSSPDRIPPILQALTSALSDSDEKVRSTAPLAIAHASYLASSEVFENRIIPMLLSMLQDGSEKTRIGVAHSIVNLSASRAIPVNQLKEALADKNAVVRERVVWAIKAQAQSNYELFSQDWPDVIPFLKKMLNDPDRKARHTAAMTMAEINPDAYESIPVLLDAVSIELQQKYSMGNAKRSLKRMEEFSQDSIIPILKKHLDDEDPGIRQAAEESIIFINSK